MKLILIVFSILLFASTSFSQRYLTEVFSSLDSTIAGIYGNAVNVQSQNQDLLFDFYEPFGDTELKRPLILYIHGGGFTSGSRDYPSVKAFCRTMAKKGYTVATIDYRLDPSFDLYNSATDRRAMTDAMHDAKQAIRYFKANASILKIDTSKIFLGGESAGAVTAMMATYLDKQSEMVSYSMANPNDPIGSTANSNIGNEVQATMCLCGLLLDTSAMETTDSNPLLWVHSTDDSFIPITLAFQVVLRASNLSIPLTTKVYNGVDHCPWYFGSPNWSIYLDSVITEITDFLYPLVSSTNFLAELNLSPEIKISPNPASDLIHVQADKLITEVVCYDHYGKLVLSTNSSEINISDLEKGIYHLKVRLESGFYAMGRFVKD